MVRIDKVLANKGLGSRKEIKKIIKAKRVFVNGNLVMNDDYKIFENDEIIFDDLCFNYHEFIYIMLNKPAGVICATKDDFHTTVLDLINDSTKNLFPVGRLDIDTVGLCLISNDGKLAHNLISNKKHVEKVYEVHTLNELSDNDFRLIEQGLKIDNDEICLPACIKRVDYYYYYLKIKEGKYHQIKRMMLALNNKVTYLKRIKIGNLCLDSSLSLGEYRYLSDEEILSLK